MLESFLAQLDTILLVVFGVSALVGGVLVILLRQPMRVAMALISTMVFLGGIYGLLGVHFIAAFQVLIYVGAVMVFMVYVIMLLDTRDPAHARRFSSLAIPGAIAFVLFLGALVYGVVSGLPQSAAAAKPGAAFGLNEFAVAFLNEYWLHFELTSVLLLAAVVAAVAVIKASKGDHG
jgi:NADH-quinone oxidoreductase subunit J